MNRNKWNIPGIVTAIGFLAFAMAPSAAAVTLSETREEIMGQIGGLVVAGSCPAQTIEGNGGWSWNVAGLRDPVQPGTFYSVNWKKVTNRAPSGNACQDTSYTCTINVADGATGTSSKAIIQWVKGGSTQVTGTYKGLAFAGTWGHCSPSSAGLSAKIAGVTSITGNTS